MSKPKLTLTYFVDRLSIVHSRVDSCNQIDRNYCEEHCRYSGECQFKPIAEDSAKVYGIIAIILVIFFLAFIYLLTKIFG